MSTLAPSSLAASGPASSPAAIRPSAPKPSPALEAVPSLSPELHRRFELEQRDLNLRNARIGAWIVMTLVPFCIVLDYLAYPEHLADFFTLRIICSLLCIPLLLSLRHPASKHWYRVYPIILPVLPAIAICAMIYQTGDAGSSYYVGLILCIVGTSFVFHWTFREIGITLAIVLACYFAATIPNLNFSIEDRTFGVFVNNTVFILLNCLILYVGSRQHHSIRVREFLNRCKVEDQREQLAHHNTELENTLNRLRETEAQLDQSEKLASIGRLSAGIVHEINNPLNFVKSAIFVLKKKSKKAPPELAESITRICGDIGEGVDRVSSIVSDLRTFAHPENRGARPIDLHQTAEKALRLLAKEVSDRGVRLTLEIKPGQLAQGDENYTIQVLINLVQNSLDALEDRPSPAIRIYIEQDHGQVILVVADNGPGIPEDVRKKIFDPFFTTKEVGKGMGMGLSICHRMMTQMEGDIRVRSQPGEFTEFRLHFPHAKTEAVEPAPQPITA